ncbi:MAG: Cys-Gln thioester bond-forming surface protein [Clostridia bacterium]|nr:Cys-Gln thioester bond-forming surface protein [Clostridia bacterium]
MKKLKKIIITLMITFVTLAMNFLGLANSVYAADLGKNIQLQNEGDCGALLKYDGIQLITAYVTYRSGDGKVYPAYCLNRNLKGVGTVDAYAVAANNYVTDVGLWRRIINGYPYKTIQELGCATKEEAFSATKQAIYCYIHGNNPDLYEGIGEAGARTLNALKMIVTNAQNSNETKLETSINIDKSVSTWKLDDTDKKYVSKKYSVKANSDFKKYMISISKSGNVDLPQGIKITDLKNKEKTEFSKGENFKVLIPISSLKDDGTFKLNVKSELKTKPIIYGTAPNSSLQDYALTMFEYENSEGNVEDNYYRNDTKIIIHKQDKNSQKPLEGVSFNLLNDKKEVVKKDLKTDKNGEIQIKNIMPGKYYLIETNTLKGYEKYEEKIEIEVALNEKVNITVNNIKEVKKEVEKPKEVEVKQVAKKLPKTGM